MLQKFKKWYHAKKDYIPTICFLCGSTWDVFTLRRIDNALDLAIFSIYLLLSAIIVVLITRNLNFKFSKYLPAAAQFFFGGMLSATTVYYFKSTSSFPAFLFLLFLACLLVGNEFLEKKYSNAQISFLLWSICAAMILSFVLPVLFCRMDAWIFLLAIASASILCLTIKSISITKVSLIPTIGIYSLLILLYFTNIIPPVPISTKQLGIYHSVYKNGNQYICSLEKPRWYSLHKKSEKKFRYSPGDTLFCFGSVFAPTQLKKKIYHHWYYMNPQKGKFEEVAKIGYRVTGGRDEGYRGYTYIRNIREGRWKVLLKTDDGKTIGTQSFKVTRYQENQSRQLTALSF